MLLAINHYSGSNRSIMIIAENVTWRLLLRWDLTSIPVCLLFHDTLFFSNAIKRVVWRSNFSFFHAPKTLNFQFVTLPHPSSLLHICDVQVMFSDSAQSIVHNSYAGRFPDRDGYTCCWCTCCSKKKKQKKQRRCALAGGVVARIRMSDFVSGGFHSHDFFFFLFPLFFYVCEITHLLMEV